MNDSPQPTIHSIHHSAERQTGIEFFRAACCFFVVCLHFGPPATEFGGLRDFFIQGVCRGAVPFFFAASGYFQGRAWRRGDLRIQKQLKKLIVIWAVWLPVGVLFNAFQENGFRLLESRGIPGLMYYLFIEGGFGHMWFIPSLFLTILWTSLAVPRIGETSVLIIATVLYILAMADQGAYPGLKFPLPGASKDMIWFSSLPFMCGHWLAGKKWNLGPWAGLLIALLAVSFHRWRAAFLGENMIIFESTFLIGVGFLLCGLSIRGGEKWLPATRHTLGIYCLHGFPCMILGRMLLKDFSVSGFLILLPPLSMYAACYFACWLASTGFKWSRQFRANSDALHISYDKQ